MPELLGAGRLGADLSQFWQLVQGHECDCDYVCDDVQVQVQVQVHVQLHVQVTDA